MPVACAYCRHLVEFTTVNQCADCGKWSCPTCDEVRVYDLGEWHGLLCRDCGKRHEPLAVLCSICRTMHVSDNRHACE